MMVIVTPEVGGGSPHFETFNFMPIWLAFTTRFPTGVTSYITISFIFVLSCEVYWTNDLPYWCTHNHCEVWKYIVCVLVKSLNYQKVRRKKCFFAELTSANGNIQINLTFLQFRFFSCLHLSWDFKQWTQDNQVQKLIKCKENKKKVLCSDFWPLSLFQCWNIEYWNWLPFYKRWAIFGGVTEDQQI